MDGYFCLYNDNKTKSTTELIVIPTFLVQGCLMPECMQQKLWPLCQQVCLGQLTERVSIWKQTYKIVNNDECEKL